MAAENDSTPQLVRGLGAWDTALITIGTMLGSSIFVAAALVPRALPHPSLVLGAWIVGGVLTIAGALTYAELRAMFPRAGGQYHFLKEAFGPFSGFMFGWASFLVAQSAANAYVAVAFADYLGAFIPSVSTAHAVLSVPLGSWTWQVNTVQLVGAAAIAALTAINYLGLKEGAGVQNVLTILKAAAIVLLCLAGFAVPAHTTVNWFAPLPTGSLATGLGVALVGVFGAYDGWYQATFVSGEIRDPERNILRGLAGGVISMTMIYTLVNLTYLRALPPLPGCSTLITVAPSSARIIEANGQASTRDRSSTVMPCSGFIERLSWLIRAQCCGRTKPRMRAFMARPRSSAGARARSATS